MFDFLVQNSIYVVLIIALLIWLGIGIFLSVLDTKVSKLQKVVELNKKENEIES